jgi:hypothetical protein
MDFKLFWKLKSIFQHMHVNLIEQNTKTEKAKLFYSFQKQCFY